MSTKVAVIGSNGQLGQDVVTAFNGSGFEVFPLTHKDIEVADIASVRSVFKMIRPHIVVNTAAFHNVNACETSKEKAQLVNSLGASNVAQTVLEVGGKTIFVSTDYVFSGNVSPGKFNKTTDEPAPLNVYGETKFAGEQRVLEIDPANLVFRVSSVFGVAGSSGKGGNFVEAILGKVSAGQTAEVIDDSLMSPTYTRSASSILVDLVNLGVSGVQHGSSVGQCSWFDLASFAAAKVGKSDLVVPIQSPANQFPLRPVNSSLDTTDLLEFGVSNLDWQESLTKYLQEKGVVS